MITFLVETWVRETLGVVQTVRITVVKDTDVFQRRADGKRLANIVGQIVVTAGLLFLANAGVQFAGAARESWGTFAFVRVLGGDASTAEQTGLRVTNVLVHLEFVFASMGFAAVQETLGTEEFVTPAVSCADDKLFTLVD